MKNKLNRKAIILGALLLTACQSKGPTPNEGAAAATETQKPTADPHAGLDLSPQQQTAVDKIPRPEPDASGKIDLGAVTMQVPEAWTFQKPRALMRRAQFKVPGPGGEAESVVFFMGTAGAGSEQANIDRWIAQFTNKDGSRIVDVTPVEKKVSGFEVTQIEVAGEYDGGMTPGGQPGQATSEQRLIAAIVSTSKGPYYIKLLGPTATVAENRKVFDDMIASIKPTP
ncbi:MAG: hypothetical protein OEM15_01270 [Myxococcales bacterium]|nr:hypothetical protein [Myxococcales bacterium]MDH3484822.1 hypothetical protein [Myxococcales bacterium]